jgi:hypothetical protein
MTEPTCVAICGRPSSDAFICRTCTSRLERILAELPAQLIELRTTIAKQARANRGDQGKTTKAASQPLPLDLRAAHLADLAQAALASWIKHLCETRGVPEPDFRRAGV